MEKGAAAVHRLLLQGLQNYIETQYFGKTPILFNALKPKFEEEGVLYQKPYIEASPVYKKVKDGFNTTNLPEWLKKFFLDLGVYSAPYLHQLKALEAIEQGQDLFVSTGTGSGKTECFLWPLLAKLMHEAKERPKQWKQRGVRVVVMYPMNALVADQQSRLRRLIGNIDEQRLQDSGKNAKKPFIDLFHEATSAQTRRPQFGTYTGRTPYPGDKTVKSRDAETAESYKKYLNTKKSNPDYYKRLLESGRLPSKTDLDAFASRVRQGVHEPDPNDAELLTRFEMQKYCPDVLITNYSMLEYMLLRPIEQKIWDETKNWLELDPKNKLLFVIDEAHAYRGSSGGEVALLLRRLFYKLEIARDRVQFILTTASMPNSSDEDRNAKKEFARALTALDSGDDTFCYLTGEREELIASPDERRIPQAALDEVSVEELEKDEDSRSKVFINFCSKLCPTRSFNDFSAASEWAYDRFADFKEFRVLFTKCRGEAVALKELAKKVFPDREEDSALEAVGKLLALAPLAKSAKNETLFPARMHMLFQGVKGVYACCNPNCPKHCSDDGIELGEVFISDAGTYCPSCGCNVYELVNDRRCGALFFKGFISKKEFEKHNNVYLWESPGRIVDDDVIEIHLYIPPKDFTASEYNKGRKPEQKINLCYLNVQTGYIQLHDDSKAEQENYRKLYYTQNTVKDKPDVLTFNKCPKCLAQQGRRRLTPFEVRGNQTFFNLVASQFNAQPPVPRKDGDPTTDLAERPNQGRKVLLFSDSRQKAATLARDMSQASDRVVFAQLFVHALASAEEYHAKRHTETSLNNLYPYFLKAALEHNVLLFDGHDRQKFKEAREYIETKFERLRRDPDSKYSFDRAPTKAHEQLLRLFCGAYNTLSDAGLSWIEPTSKKVHDIVLDLQAEAIDANEELVLDVFNAWYADISEAVALSGVISIDARRNVFRSYDNIFGLKKDWKFSDRIAKTFGWTLEDHEIWKDVFEQLLIDISTNGGEGYYYLNSDNIKACFSLNQSWTRCNRCAQLTHRLLKSRCPFCGGTEHETLNYDKLNQYFALWRTPLLQAINDPTCQFHAIDVEEHTAQLSSERRSEGLSSQTEQYELRFQDIVDKDETPVDVLSCTTTMEVGVDIGSLVAVGLRNMPPTRENYQQRAGRAGRRGSSLSTIVAYCEGSPHDSWYFRNPAPMFKGEPRRPFIDAQNEKLIVRHLGMVVLEEFLAMRGESLDRLGTLTFVNKYLEEFKDCLQRKDLTKASVLIPLDAKGAPLQKYKDFLIDSLEQLKKRCKAHPELYVVYKNYPTKKNNADSSENAEDKQIVHVPLLDSLYEEGAIPTYSFPKNVVTLYINKPQSSEPQFEIQRGIDIALSEYAPGRSIVVNKETYQIGGIFCPASLKQFANIKQPAKEFFTENSTYFKKIKKCYKCGWFGLESDDNESCPFCGNPALQSDTPMLRPWGLTPKDGRPQPAVQVQEQYTTVQEPLYSTVPARDKLVSFPNFKRLHCAQLEDQRVIVLNKGENGKGFMVCTECGAAMPGNTFKVLKGVERPYYHRLATSGCKHHDCQNVNLGFDFITDMMVLEIELDAAKIDVSTKSESWRYRAGKSLGEALRLTVSQKLDIDYSEIVVGCRHRDFSGRHYVDIYLYDNLSGGAGYSSELAQTIDVLLEKTKVFLQECSCKDACHSCLKHYGNRFNHPYLDRYAASQLIDWCRSEMLPEATLENTLRDFKPYRKMFQDANYEIVERDGALLLSFGNITKELISYPEMLKAPCQNGDVVYVSDGLLKRSKPIAFQQIREAFGDTKRDFLF